MTIKSRQEYLQIMRERYETASKSERSALLDEVCSTCTYSRKHAIALLSPTRSEHRAVRAKPAPRPRGRPRRYDDPQIKTFLTRVWKAGNLPCGKRLWAMIPLWLPFYRRQNGQALSEKIQALLRDISAATIDRLLAPVRHGQGKIGLATTKPDAILRTQIPMQRSQWREDRPGFFETDTVAHCGTSVSGSFAYTMNLVDIATGWTEQWALWGRGQHGIVRGLKTLEMDLPFALLGLDSDNGTEFINWQLHNYLRHRKNPVRFTRGRPEHANDNAHIEQKNWCVVRQYLGYDRFDNPAVVPRMNALYRGPLRLLLNFFMPSMKQIEKHRVGEKIKRKHDDPQTPYERVLLSPHVKKAKKKQLTALFQRLDPFHLTQEIHRLVIEMHVHTRCDDPDCPYHQ
jgi:hypothetical protein